jgi:hypothetical protein
MINYNYVDVLLPLLIRLVLLLLLLDSVEEEFKTVGF